MDAPAPLECHPAYLDRREWLVDWLDNPLSGDAVQIPSFDDFAAATDTYVSVKAITMTRKLAAGPAPYVGPPFRYEWWVGVDELGRCVAGDSRVVYDDPRHEPRLGPVV